MWVLRYVLFSLVVFMQTIAICQQSNYLHTTYGTRDGLVSPKVYALAQGTNRLLWIGTESGVSIYNGYEFVNFQYTANNEKIGRILTIAEDSTHLIWMGGDRGLFCYSDNKIRQIATAPSHPLAVESLLTDTKGNLWIGDINSLYRIESPQLRKVKDSLLFPVDIKPFAGFSKRAFALSEDHDHHIYAAGFDAIYKFPAGSGRFEEAVKNELPNEAIKTLVALSADRIFYSRVTDLPRQYLHGQSNRIPQNAYIGRTFFKNHSNIYVLTTNTISVLQDNALIPLLNYDSITRHAHTAIIDAEGNFWIGSWEGLQKFRPSPFKRYTVDGEEEIEIFSMYEKASGELLFGANHGKVLTMENGRVVKHRGIPALFPLAEVMCMYESKEGALWAGSGYQGISRFADGKVDRYMPAGNLKDNNCEMLYAAEDGRLLACTENGVTVIDPANKEPFIKHYAYVDTYSRYPELFGAFNTQTSPYWAYGSYGLFRIEDDKLTVDSISGLGITRLYISKMVADKKGNVWVATLGQGLLRCRIQNNQLQLQQVFTTGQLPSNFILSVIVDDADHVWCADYAHLSRLEAQAGTYEIVSFNEKDGLLSAYYSSLKLEKQKNGTIWLLTSMGFLSFHPQNLQSNPLPPVLTLDRATLNASNSEALQDLDFQTKNKLQHDENNLQFAFTAVSLTDPSKIRYATRLLGLDTNWVISSNREVNYRHLRPGHYTLQVKASNNNAVWTSTPLEFQFVISPPFWQTWWFISLIVLVLIAILLFVFRQRLLAIKAKENIKQQMAQLEARAIRAQMNPHFIFNSLNAIQESIVLNDFDTSYQYLSKFSKLLRMVLELSEKNMIALRDEIEMNRLYLELESLRFRNSFSYALEVDEEIDVHAMQFPSIVVQPFIENAIWHGLLPKPGDKFVSVRYMLTDDGMDCVIEDNGIGREKAAAIKMKKLGSSFFASKAIGLVQQRMNVLGQTGMVKASFSIIDKKDTHGEATGTKVIISIPTSKTSTL